MNLTRDPWIPALRLDGRHERFSLQDLFAQAHQLRDLAVKPHERISVMRLLACVTHAALGGPADESEWATCKPQIQRLVREYLNTWQHSFELFGDGPRFLQLPHLTPGKPSDDGNAATKLDLTLSTGNNSTLFDNRAGEERTIDPARAALNLLTFQCFAPGGRIGVAKWNGKDTAGNGSSRHAPCTPSSMVHTLALGSSLLDTIHLNLVCRDVGEDVYGSDGWGRPLWELPVISDDDQAAIQNATLTYVGRLVALSRAVRLHENGHSVILANGLTYPIYPAFREATATIIRRDRELAVLPASTGRSFWRQLAAITAVRHAKREASGPLANGHALNGVETYFWVGALATAKSKSSKIEDVIESTYVLPTGMFTDFGRAAYEQGVAHAEAWERALREAVKAYAARLQVSAPAYNEARRHFWTRVEQHLSSLFDLARHVELVTDLPETDWGAAVRGAAITAFRQACPVGTPRQIQAHAIGLRKFAVAPSTHNPTPDSNERNQTISE